MKLFDSVSGVGIKLKLLFCNKCQDLFKLSKQVKSCSCGTISGAYENDGRYAWYKGFGAIPIGLNNSNFVKLLHGLSEFDDKLFVIKDSERFVRVD